MKTAFLLIAHGSRHPDANADLLWLAKGLRDRGHPMVVASFLELADPPIPEGGRQCVSQGADRVVLLPYFLSAGVHVLRDLRAHRQQLAETYPNVQFLLAEPLGRDEILIDLVARRAAEAQENLMDPSQKKQL